MYIAISGETDPDEEFQLGVSSVQLEDYCRDIYELLELFHEFAAEAGFEIPDGYKIGLEEEDTNEAA